MSAATVPPWVRRLLLAPAMAALVVAVWSGLARIGWALPVAKWEHIALHGPLMVCGLFGTLISLERAVALGVCWTYLGPLAGGVGAVLALAGKGELAMVPFTASSIVLAGACLLVVRRQSAVFTWVMTLGAGAWLVGNVLWNLRQPLFEVVWWWAGFLVLTIAAERLELSRLVRPPEWARHLFPVLVGVAVLGLVLARPVLLGAGLLALALWLARFDVARRTIRQPGLPRYAATALLAGYAWLAFAGLVLCLQPPPPAGPLYDAVLHALFVGFVLSMVFAHAPIILPAVARVDIPFHPSLYAPLLVLHASLVARVSGDLLGHADLRRGGGLGNALAILLFGACVVMAKVRRGRAR